MFSIKTSFLLTFETILFGNSIEKKIVFSYNLCQETFKMPKYAEKNRIPKTELCASNLRAVLRFRNMSVPDLAKTIGVSSRTLEAYTAGRVSMLDAKAGTVLKIAQALNVDPYILIGEKSVDGFFRKEEAKQARRKKRYADLVIQTEDGNIIPLETKYNDK